MVEAPLRAGVAGVPTMDIRRLGRLEESVTEGVRDVVLGLKAAGVDTVLI